MLSISHFSKITRISSKTLRFYDEIDLLKPIYVDEKKYRYYKIEQLREVMFIQKLKQYDCSLDEIKQIINNPDCLLKIMCEKKEIIESKMNGYTYAFLTIDEDIEKIIKGEDILIMSDKIKIEILTYNKVSILSVRKNINVKNFSTLLNELFFKLEKENHTPIAPPMAIYHSEEYIPEDYDIEVAVPISDDINCTRVFNPGTCAMVEYQGFYEDIPKIYAQLSMWMEDNEYILSNSPFEVYLSEPDIASNKKKVAIYFPITKNLNRGSRQYE